MNYTHPLIDMTVVKVIEKWSKKVIFLQHGPHVTGLEVNTRMILTNSRGVSQDFEIVMIVFMDTYKNGKLETQFQNIFVD